MSHTEKHFKESKAELKEIKKSRRDQLLLQARPALGDLEMVIMTGRYIVNAEQHQHMYQKLKELQLLMNEYLS